jgi:hypothetical protein
MDFLGAYLFGIISPLIAALVAGGWLALLIRFSLLPLWLERSKITADEKERVTKSATRVILGIGLIGVPIVPILCCNTQFLHRLGDLGAATIGERSLGVVGLFPFSPVWLALIVEEWLVLVCHFGLPHFLNRLRIPVDLHQDINWYVVMAILLIGILTGLGGFSWWIYTANVDWNRFEKAYRFGMTVLSPATGLLAIGMAVMLPVSLVQALSMEKKDDQREQVARNMIAALSLTFVLLSVVGSIWSASIYRTMWY